MAVVIEVVSQESVANTTPNISTQNMVVDVISTPATNPNYVETTVLRASTTEVVQPTGTIANVSYGYGWPEYPYEGMVWIKLHE